MADQPSTPDAGLARRLRLLFDLSCAFAARTDLDELIDLVVAKCRDILDAEGASILLHDPEKNELYFPYFVAADANVAAELARLRVPVDQGIAGTVFRTGESMRVDAAAADPRLYREVDRRTQTATHSLLCAPLRTPQTTLGVIEVVNHRGGSPFPPDDLDFLETLAGSVAVAIENARLLAALRNSEQRLRAEVGVLRRDLARQDRFADLVGTGPAMAEVFRLMESAAATPITVHIQGETGTGKELVARALHRASERADGPFIAVNCAALPESLLESELFGHRRGAFTGALADRVGLFEAAKGGTIFLDEIGEMPAVMQAKLLRVLQEGEVVPVGDNRPRKVDVRVISATNRDLAAEVAADRFRRDLYYRVVTFPIRLPPLRDRREDVAPIAMRLLERVAARYRKKVPGFAPAALAALAEWSWPGNVRELQNEIERATALVLDGRPIDVDCLSVQVREAVCRGDALAPPGPAAGDHGPRVPLAGAPPAVGPTTDASTTLPPVPGPAPDHGAAPADLREARAAWEIGFIRDSLAAAGGNVTHAAKAMGLSRVALQKKMKEYGLRAG